MGKLRPRSETGSMIFAIISVTTSSLGIAIFSGLLIYVSTQLHKQIDGQGLMPYIMNLVIILALLIVYFIFSVLLLNGIKNHKPKQVLAYIVFGIVVCVVSVTGAVAWIILAPSVKSNNLVVGGVWLFLSFMYMLILTMVCLAYRKIKAHRPKKPKKQVITLRRKILDGLGTK